MSSRTNGVNRILATGFVASLAFALWATFTAPFASAAATDVNKFLRSLEKVVATGIKPQGVLCVCKDFSANQDKAGMVFAVGDQVGNIESFDITCYVQEFDANTGAIAASLPCSPWELLRK